MVNIMKMKKLLRFQTLFNAVFFFQVNFTSIHTFGTQHIQKCKEKLNYLAKWGSGGIYRFEQVFELLWMFLFLTFIHHLV